LVSGPTFRFRASPCPLLQTFWNTILSLSGLQPPGSCQTNGMTEFLGAAPVLPAHNLAESVDWFERKLGFRTEFLYPAENPVFAIVSRDGVEIHLRAAPVDAAHNPCQCYFGVTGVEDLYHEYLVRGVIHPAGDLETKPWGQKEFTVLELNGAMLVFGEPSE
jgi:hypothetical protein